jgi:hypothetical protein
MSDHPDARRPGLLAPGSPVVTAVVVLTAYAVMGIVAGVVWQWVWTPPGQVIQNHQLFYDSDASLRRVFTGTGIYVLVGAAASALVALVVGLRTRGRELLVLLLVVVGSALAAALMWRVGTLLGPPDPATLAAHTTAVTRISGQLTVAGKSPYLAWPMASLLVLALIYFGWPSSLADRAPAERAPTDRREPDLSGPPPD